jgi:hypothetical protein
MMSLKELVAAGQVVNFEYYRDGNLWYVTSSGFSFPVPISDVGNATFFAQDKAMLFMRYIRKQLNVLADAEKAKILDGIADGSIETKPLDFGDLSLKRAE